MEAVWQNVAEGLNVAVLAALLKKHTPELALLLAVAVCGAAALAAVRGVREVWAFLEDLLAAVEISSTLFHPLLKTAGIAVVTRIGADLCRDAGESAVASAVEMAPSNRFPNGFKPALENSSILAFLCSKMSSGFCSGIWLAVCSVILFFNSCKRFEIFKISRFCVFFNPVFKFLSADSGKAFPELSARRVRPHCFYSGFRAFS